MSEIEGIEQVYKNVLIQIIDGISVKGKDYYWANCIFLDGEVVSTCFPFKSIDGAVVKARLIIDRRIAAQK